MPTKYIESDTIPIGLLLSTVSALKVPTFQRNYAWTDDEVSQFWDDLIEALDTSQSEYFLGPMVFKKKNNHFEIIDGQQRIAAVYSILSGIRYLFRTNGDDQRVDWFNNEYFGKKDINTLELQPKFQMNEVNDEIFQKYIVADADEASLKIATKGLLKKDSNYLLLRTEFTIRELLKKRQKDFSGQDFDRTTLLGLHTFLREHVYVLLLKVADEADAYMIFETLNDRGRELSTMDLLKNHIFDKSGGYLDTVKAQWALLRDNLSDIDPKDRFFYHYWTSFHGRTSKPQLFRLMRKGITNPKTAVEFSKNLSEISKLYSALIGPSSTYWNEYDQTTRDNLEVLSLLDAQQALPILIAAAKEFSSNEFSKLTRIIVVMAVRYNLICELRTGVLANYYVDIPKKIRSKDILKSAKVFREIKEIYPSDEDFQKAFSSKILRDSRKARYLLGEIENSVSGGKTQIVNDSKKVNLDHILPRNPSQEWRDTLKSIGEDDVQKYIYRIGNFALVSSTLNKGQGSKSFESKKGEIYAKEREIYFTKSLCDYATWIASDIEHRQREIARAAVNTWRIDIQ
jgi:uncharacterized protein with ParB-like and HNH nuclease domain